MRNIEMKNFFFLLIGLMSWQAGAARTSPAPAGLAQPMRDVFASMPDSILEIMTKNNRLDCIDFIEHNMEAKVRNRFDGYTVLKQLTLDYLDLQLTKNCRVEMKLLPVKDSVDYICVVRTYAGPVQESTVRLYTPQWEELPATAWMEWPDYEAFWTTNDTINAEEVERLQRLQDMRFVKAGLQPDDMRLTLSLQPGEVEKETAGRMEAVIRPLVYEWDGKRFFLLENE